jgi:hypothetical protein
LTTFKELKMFFFRVVISVLVLMLVVTMMPLFDMYLGIAYAAVTNWVAYTAHCAVLIGIGMCLKSMVYE